jgi:putative inorganic carbon (HCO3(-)) transporter
VARPHRSFAAAQTRGEGSLSGVGSTVYSTRDILVLAPLAIALPFCFFRPYFGIILWTIFAYVNPHRYAWGAARDFPVAEAIAIATLAGLLVFVRNWKLFFSKGVGLLILLWFWFTVTTLITTDTPIFMHHAQQTWMQWEKVSKILLMTLVLIGLVDDWKRFRIYVLTLAGSFGVLVLKLLPFMILTDGSQRIYGPDGSMIADNNDFGLALNMTLPMFFFLSRTEDDWRLKWLMRFLFPATTAAILFTYSRGALVGLVAIGVLMFLRLKQRFLLLPIMILAFLFGSFFTTQEWRDRMYGFSHGEIDSSAAGRINAWKFAFHLAQDYPITGGGFDTFTPELFQRYAPNPTDVHAAHSVYFGLLGEQGFVGLFLFLLVVVACYIRMQRIIWNARRWGDKRAAEYASMFQFSLVGFLASGAFLGRAYFDYFYSVIACSVILWRLCQSEWTTTMQAELAAEPHPDDALDVESVSAADSGAVL